jgi:hypothetical protein
MSIHVEDLAGAVAEALTEYQQEVTDGLKESVKQAGKVCVKELKKTSPQHTGDYAKGWRSTVAYESDSDIRVQVHNKTNYQLTHLLEDGHAKAGGGRVEGKPHIGPAADNAAKTLEKDVQIRVGLK